jgi:hypothetical protein
MEYFILNAGSPSQSLLAGAAGELTRGLKNETTGEHPLELFSGDSISISVGSGATRGSRLRVNRPGQSSVFYGQSGYEVFRTDTDIFDIVPGEETVVTSYTAENSFTDISETRTVTGQNPGTSYYVRTSTPVFGGAGLGGGGKAPRVEWYSRYEGNYVCGRGGSFPNYYNLYCSNNFNYPRLAQYYQWTAPGIESFNGSILGEGGSAGISFGYQAWNSKTGTSVSASSYNRTPWIARDGRANTGEGGAPSVNELDASDLLQGVGGSGLIQIRYSESKPLLPNIPMSMYTRYNGYHVYTFNESRSIQI